MRLFFLWVLLCFAQTSDALAQTYYLKRPAASMSGKSLAVDSEQTKLNDAIDQHVLQSLPDLDVDVVELSDAALASIQHELKQSGSDWLIEAVPKERLFVETIPWHVDMVQARDAWDTNRDKLLDANVYDGSGVKVCIIDSGIKADHSDFVGVTLTGDSLFQGEAWSTDGVGHGTHVAGVLNASLNNQGLTGVMPGTAALHVVKYFNNDGQSSPLGLATAVQKCLDAGSNIINMSLGAPNPSQTNQAAMEAAYNQGVLLLAAVGNDGSNGRQYPAFYSSVIGVGALHQDEQAANYSQTPLSLLNPNSVNPEQTWDGVELMAGGTRVMSTVSSPDGGLPQFEISAAGLQLNARHVSGSAAGVVTADWVDGGSCDVASSSWSANIVLCTRGNNTFADKVNLARAQNALGIIIRNDQNTDLSAACGETNGASNCTQPSIPALTITQADGQALINQATGQPITLTADTATNCPSCVGGYNYKTGTSMATPAVAGIAGLVWDACGSPQSGITNKQLRQILRAGAKDLTGTQDYFSEAGETASNRIQYGVGYDQVTGWGLSQFTGSLQRGAELFATCPNFGLSLTPKQAKVCSVSSASVQTDVQLASPLQTPATLSISGLPAGVTAVYNSTNLAVPSQQILQLDDWSQVAAGKHVLDIRANDASQTRIHPLHVDVTSSIADSPSLYAPSADQREVILQPMFSWLASALAESYVLEVALDEDFTNIILSKQTSSTSHQVTQPLSFATTYYWRVRAVNVCGESVPSRVYRFSTESKRCVDVNQIIPDNDAMGTSHTLTLTDARTIIDLNVDLDVDALYAGDIVAKLTHTNGTGSKTVILLDRPGMPPALQGCLKSNIKATFNDEAPTVAETMCHPSSPTISGLVRPWSSLTAFDGRTLAGQWQITISDEEAQGSGVLKSWCLSPKFAQAPTNQPPFFTSPDQFTVLRGVATIGSAKAEDPEESAIRYALQAGGDGLFAIEPNTGALSILSLNAVSPDQSPYTLIIRATDADGDHADQTINIIISDQNTNQKPIIQSQSFNVPMQAEPLTVVGQVVASDPDPNDQLIFTLASGNEDNAFVIDAQTGRISVANSLALRTGRIFLLNVSVRDDGFPQQHQTSTVTIKVLGSVLFTNGFEE